MEANQGPLTPPRSVEEKPISIEDTEDESVVIKDVKLGTVALEEESRVADILPSASEAVAGLVTNSIIFCLFTIKEQCKHFFTNPLSRFALVVFDTVLVPSRLPCHT